MKNIKIVMEYEGTNYHGWQKQPEEISIQEVVESRISEVTQEEISLIGSGRTDSGVHALAQVGNFHTRSKIPARNFKKILNSMLPEDIKIIDSKEVGRDFHARFSADMKEYKYIIYNNRQPRPLYRNYSYHVIEEIDIAKMIDASKLFIGRKDFKSFMATDSLVYTTVRTMSDIDIEVDGDFIEIRFMGKSFLRHMIRIIVGTLVYVGVGKIELDEVEGIIAARDRLLAGITAPAQGLYLKKVYYSR